eukprot:1711201-Pyramimonas_sp.AAC.1
MAAGGDHPLATRAYTSEGREYLCQTCPLLLPKAACPPTVVDDVSSQRLARASPCPSIIDRAPGQCDESPSSSTQA